MTVSASGGPMSDERLAEIRGFLANPGIPDEVDGKPTWAGVSRELVAALDGLVEAHARQEAERDANNRIQLSAYVLLM